MSTELSSRFHSDHTPSAPDAEYEALMTELEGMRSVRQTSRLAEPAFLRYRLMERKRAVNEILASRGILFGSDIEVPAFLRKHEALQAMSQYDETLPQEIRDRMWAYAATIRRLIDTYSRADVTREHDDIR